MPTGYTAKIAEGQTFEQFIWDCARAFGALIMMRDDPSDAPIPERFEPAPFYKDMLDKAQNEFAEWAAMSEQARRDMMALEVCREEQAREASEARRRATSEAYAAMLGKVRAWEPPTDDHIGLRDFMIQQIEESIRFDCGHEYPRAQLVSFEAWQHTRLKCLLENMARYADENRKEIERTESRNQWIEKLRESLK